MCFCVIRKEDFWSGDATLVSTPLSCPVVNPFVNKKMRWDEEAAVLLCVTASVCVCVCGGDQREHYLLTTRGLVQL